MMSALYFLGALFCLVVESASPPRVKIPAASLKELRGATAQRSPIGVCSGTGDPHWKTYDGLHYDFHGYGKDCLYIMSELCVPGNLQHFQVLTRHRLCNGGTAANPVSCIVYVEVKVFGLTVSIDFSGVKINGFPVSVPSTYSWLTNKLWITNSGGSINVMTNFGLKVIVHVGTSWIDVRIWLPVSYGNRVCGLCGNFNGDNSDDTTTINDFDECKNPGALSWIVPDCACDGEKNPKCWTPCRKHTTRRGLFDGLTRRNLEVARKFFEIARIKDAIHREQTQDTVDKDLHHDVLLRNAAFDLDHKAPHCAVFETIAGEVKGANTQWKKVFACPDNENKGPHV